ncbi:MAG TPA: LysM peptidoglycan-binding domain-containing protein [Dyella sp.]|uniref:LysM peptidoglycan-binding domain-containing protein n=1 Tax=Dyella sp. TaxID=1869338 RepID=UPI002D798984|nr:LysM peptidoglycan-binding domain-containing protein [Dyella sp.]HET6554367.1 LysM peptidoglycan-binding domain-containing protein [Dyella sp.]
MRRLRPLPLAMSALLAACATTPTPKPQAPKVQAPAPEPVRDISHPVMGTTRPNDNGAGMWDQLRGSFQMADCDADPGITLWARRYTQNPERFENQLAAAAPRLAYVQQVAARHHVAGEFALLPWVESQYRPIPGGKNMPAGMWQIMPTTANAMGIRVDKNFDGRMDVPAATDAIMALLSRYHDDLDDWRLVDYAFNAGEFGIKRMVAQHGTPSAEPVVPKMPVKAVTREHLVKLLAIACVIREPDRFNVSLPSLPSEERLVTVAIDNSMPIAHAANRAGMSTDELKDLNAGFRNGVVDSSASSYLLLPSNHVQQFRNSPLAAGNDTAPNVPGTTVLPPLGATLSASTADDDNKASGKHSDGEKTHTVKSGESLWSIARRYSLDVRQLQQWNHLQSAGVKPGQILKVSAPS